MPEEELPEELEDLESDKEIRGNDDMRAWFREMKQKLRAMRGEEAEAAKE